MVFLLFFFMFLLLLVLACLYFEKMIHTHITPPLPSHSHTTPSHIGGKRAPLTAAHHACPHRRGRGEGGREGPIRRRGATISIESRASKQGPVVVVHGQGGMQAFLPFLPPALLVRRRRRGARRGAGGGGGEEVGREGGREEGAIVGGGIALVLVAPLGQGLEFIERLGKEGREGGREGSRER